jgi:protein-glutamine gamma-glutamyltransferase
MIYVSGKPLDITALQREYPGNSVENIVLKKMNDSELNYRYDYLNQLKFELRLRREIVRAANSLNKSGMGFEVFHQSKCNENFWIRTDNGGFRKKPGVNSSDAINDIFQNGRKYKTECATAMVIVIYKALLNVFGAELFNRVFPSIYLMNWHALDPVIREFGSPREAGDILPGDRAYFKNPDVDPKTPEWQGENVIVLPGGLYYGHGIGITNSERIIRALNQNRRRDADRSAYLMSSVSRLNFKRLAEQYNGSLPETASPQFRPISRRSYA